MNVINRSIGRARFSQLLHLTGLPPVSLLQLRQWAGHSTVTQHVDIRPPMGGEFGYYAEGLGFDPR